jgi:hypothetical protein
MFMYLKNLNLKMKKYLQSKIISDNFEYLLFFRVAICVVALADLATLAGDFGLFFSKDNTIIPQELLYLFTEHFYYLNPMYEFLAENGLTNIFYQTIPWLYVLALVSLAVGFCNRFSAFTAIILQLIIFKSFPVYNYGYDQFLTMSLFYCLVFPVGKVYSVNNLLFKKNRAIKHKFNYQYVILLHLSIVYLFAGLAKIISKTWWNGEAIWRSLSTIYNDFFKIHPLILTTVGIVTILTETLYPFLMSFEKTKKISFFLIMGMHIGIAFILDLPIFAAIMIVWNITAHYDLVKKILKVK